MSLIKWTPFNIDPFDEMEKFLNNFPSSSLKGFMPAVDIYQDNENVYIETNLPGFDEKDIELSIENDVLTIKGDHQKQSEVDEKNYYRKEIRSGGFCRSIPLPAHVDGDKADAELVNGILKITIPKSLKAKAKTIKISKK